MTIYLSSVIIYSMSSIDPFATRQFYHLYNKSMDSSTPFSEYYYALHFMNLVWFYRSTKFKVSYSCYSNVPEDVKQQFQSGITNKDYFQVDILAYCIMPNHYHLLLRQNKDKGIYRFMNNISNAFTRFYNIAVSRKGPIFIPGYKSRLIHTEEQLIHVSRYIHLNPYSSGIVKSLERLIDYQFSSLLEYFHNEKLVDTSYILNTGYFLHNKNKYKMFVTNHADYQESLHYIKYLEKWE